MPIVRVTLSAVFAGALLGGIAAAGEQTYDLKKVDAKATVGVKGTTSVTITGKNGWKVNEEAPLTLKLTPGPGVTVDKNRITRADGVQKSKDTARFDVAFTASEPGKKTIDGECSFVMCIDTTCVPVKEKVALAVDVAAPGAAASAAAPAKPAAKKK